MAWRAMGTKNHKELIRSEFSKQAEAYSRSYISNQEALSLIVRESELQEEDLVLDMATGTGFLAIELARHSRRVIGIDITPAMLARASKAKEEQGIYNLSFLMADGESLPFHDETFDVVACRLGIHHFPEPKGQIFEMKRVAKARGKVVIADILSSEDTKKGTFHNSLEILRDPSHVWAYSPPSFRSLLSEAGLNVIKYLDWLVPMDFEEWVKLTSPPIESQKTLRGTFLKDMGKDESGLRVHLIEERVKFLHHWGLFVTRPNP